MARCWAREAQKLERRLGCRQCVCGPDATACKQCHSAASARAPGSRREIRRCRVALGMQGLSIGTAHGHALLPISACYRGHQPGVQVRVQGASDNPALCAGLCGPRLHAMKLGRTLKRTDMPTPPSQFTATPSPPAACRLPPDPQARAGCAAADCCHSRIHRTFAASLHTRVVRQDGGRGRAGAGPQPGAVHECRQGWALAAVARLPACRRREGKGLPRASLQRWRVGRLGPTEDPSKAAPRRSAQGVEARGGVSPQLHRVHRRRRALCAAGEDAAPPCAAAQRGRAALPCCRTPAPPSGSTPRPWLAAAAPTCARLRPPRRAAGGGALPGPAALPKPALRAVVRPAACPGHLLLQVHRRAQQQLVLLHRWAWWGRQTGWRGSSAARRGRARLQAARPRPRLLARLHAACRRGRQSSPQPALPPPAVRLNLNVAHAAAAAGGCVIVDATKRGKVRQAACSIRKAVLAMPCV